MRELKQPGLNSQGLTLYYTTNIRSVLTFVASLVWGSLITNNDKETIHRAESKAMMIINSDTNSKYEYVCATYQVLAVEQFIADLSRKSIATQTIR